MTITHSNQNLLLQEANRTIPAAIAVQGMHAGFSVKRHPISITHLFLPGWSDISSARLGSLRAQGLGKAPARAGAGLCSHPGV